MAKIIYKGLSSDRRTNKWTFECDCLYSHEPPTTMLAKSSISCPKCQKEFFINYNTNEVKEFVR